MKFRLVENILQEAKELEMSKAISLGIGNRVKENKEKIDSQFNIDGDFMEYCDNAYRMNREDCNYAIESLENLKSAINISLISKIEGYQKIIRDRLDNYDENEKWISIHDPIDD